MSYKTEFSSNNTDLQKVIDALNDIEPEISVSSAGLITATALGRSITKYLSSSDDTDFIADNIRAGKAIFGVTGTSWAGSLTFSGTYATSTYYTAAGSFLSVDKDTGRAFITIQGGTSTSYENIYFTATSLPSGVTLLKPPGNTNGANFGTAGTTQCYYTAVLTGITGKINVAVTMSTRASTSYDAVNCALTVTYA